MQKPQNWVLYGNFTPAPDLLTKDIRGVPYNEVALQKGVSQLKDVLYLILTVSFFAVSGALVRALDWLYPGHKP